MICQKKHHLLQEHTWPWVTEIMEKETAGKGEGNDWIYTLISCLPSLSHEQGLSRLFIHSFIYSTNHGQIPTLYEVCDGNWVFGKENTVPASKQPEVWSTLVKTYKLLLSLSFME